MLIEQPEWRRRVEVDHGLEGKWIRNQLIMTDLFHLFQSFGQPVKPFVRLQKRFPRAKVLNIRLLKRRDPLDIFLSCAIFMAFEG